MATHHIFEGDEMTTTYSYNSTTRTTADEVIQRLGELLAAQPGASRDMGPVAPVAPASAPVPAGVGETPRWMVPLIGQLAQVVAQAAPAIIQSIVDNNRDIFGEDTRDPQVRERFFGAFFSAVMPVVAQAAPLLGQIFGGNRSVPANDEELRTRWLLPLLSTVVPQLVQAAPSIIESLTGGRRSVTITDPNEATRFLGPLLGLAIPALVSAVPDIVSLFTE
ncbi:hypothetical protein [Actinoplanes sp. NBRC 103695]|uniref:hypothetical protein n=1 Tax=Actinoplanes sp. NBRC 103695 TaxID=3032202 RepID=UPI002552269E|nr:hypothetical protein [Actinoplanes sp. NBRC 103695]